MTDIEVYFPKLGHFWLDAGLVGMERLLREVESPIQVDASDAGVTLAGAEAEIEQALNATYDKLIERYYNLSTKKQRDDKISYNFFYDAKKDKFIAFPKRKSVGIAGLIYDKAPRPTGDSLKWESKYTKTITLAGKQFGRTRAKLPSTHSQLQSRLDEFLDINGLNITTSGLLVDGPNAVRPKVVIKVSTSEPKGACYLCGESSHILEDASQTTFPLITGSSGLLSFNSQAGAPEKVCWKCSFRGKFVPVAGFYMKPGDNLFAFFPYSSSLKKMVDALSLLQDTLYDDPMLRKNFQHPLGFEKVVDGFFQRPYEAAFAFLCTIYEKLIKQTPKGDGHASLDWAHMLNITLANAPLEFVVLDAQAKGQTAMAKMVWPFRDSVYFFRLLQKIETQRIIIKEIMRLYIDFSQSKFENMTLTRNRVCERILKKKSVLDLTEKHVFSTGVNFFKPLLDFLIVYEPTIRREDSMNNEEQETAVQLGKRLGMSVGNEGKKGDLFRLRKTRRKIDFLNELNRLQFKFKLTVPPDVYGGKLTDANFNEFKQFSMIAALNSFNAATSSQKGEGK